METSATKGKIRRQNNQLYYLAGIWRTDLLPRWAKRLKRRLCLRGWEKRPDADYIRDRVDYYCRVKPGSRTLQQDIPGQHAYRVGDFSRHGMGSHYYYDMGRYVKSFDPSLQMACFTCDIFFNPDGPNLMKGRRLDSRRDNCALLNLDSRRHFMKVYDSVPFAEKKPVLFFRGAITGKPHRIAFFERWADHPLFDLGDTAHDCESPWGTAPVSIPDHFAYQFILCLEGNDFASALQWVMASNCVPVMTRPTVEGWLMHGRLQPGVHYIEIADDYSDAADKLTWYTSHPEKAARIAAESKRWAAQFDDRRRENIISYLVVERFLKAVNTPE